MEWLRLGARARRELSGEERAHRANYIASVLNAGKVDELRRIAVESGFLSAALRRKIWPLLLNIQDDATASRQCDRDLALDHREKKQVQLDVVRSMTHFGLNRENRDVRLKQLSRVIDSVLAANPALHYYQGYNDVCSVAIMVMDNEDAARQVSQQLARYYLREAMNPTMAAVQQALTFMMLILKRRDKPLYNCLRACEVEPVFAISWIITWFAHDIKSLPQVERLYDFFLASHPLMSLYFAVSLMHGQRAQLLKTDGDYAEVHRIMQELPRDLPLSVLIHDAHRLFQQAPPASIVAEAAAARSLSGSDALVISNDSMWLQYPYNFQTDLLSTPGGVHREVRAARQKWMPHSMKSIQIVWGEVKSTRYGFRGGEGMTGLLQSVLAGGGIAVSVAVLGYGAGPMMRAMLATP